MSIGTIILATLHLATPSPRGMLMRSPSNPGFPPRGLWSLPDMLTLDGRKLLMMAHHLTEMARASAGKRGRLSPKDCETIGIVSDRIIDLVRAMDLPTSVTMTQESFRPAKSHEEINRAVQGVFNTISVELKGRKFYGPLRKFGRRYTWRPQPLPLYSW